MSGCKPLLIFKTNLKISKLPMINDKINTIKKIIQQTIKETLSQPLDRLTITVLAVVSVLIIMLLWNGSHTAPRVRDFTWQDKQIGADDISFILTFSRPMNRASVEENLKIEPILPGKFSWSGRRMSYRLLSPAPYGMSYQIKLEGAKDRFSSEEKEPVTIQPFKSKFRSRDQAFVYLGIQGEEKGRLILVNLSEQKPIPVVLTPKDLMVMDFKIYPEGDRILFSAIDRSDRNTNFLDQELYTVTTGINPDSPIDLQNPETETPKKQPAGKINKILDSKEYQNLQFDLSANGKIIIVQRVNKRNPGGDFGLWQITAGGKPQPLKNQPGGEFLITPDSNSIAIAQGQGIAILPLTPEAEPLDYLAKFGRVIAFTKDNSTAAMVKFNTDYTRSLFLVNNQGVEKEILKTTGSIISAQFDPLNQNLYCLLTQLIKGKNYQEQPFLAVIDLKSGKLTPLVVLPNQRDIQISLSPDGLAILFDQLITQPPLPTTPLEAPRTSDGRIITSSSLWLLPLTIPTPEDTTKLQPEQLPPELAGFRPKWLP